MAKLMKNSLLDRWLDNLQELSPSYLLPVLLNPLLRCGSALEDIQHILRPHHDEMARNSIQSFVEPASPEAGADSENGFDASSSAFGDAVNLNGDIRARRRRHNSPLV